MPTLSPQVTPYYGGGQVVNPANVIPTSGAPSNKLTEDKIGTIAVDNAAGNIYGLASKSGGVDTWVLLGGSSGAISNVVGTANQITVNVASNVATISLPSAITVPGSLTMTGKLSLSTGANSSTGVSGAMTSGAVTVSNTSVTANSKILAYPAVLGTVTLPQAYYISAITPGTSFVITSGSATDTSTWNYAIFN